MLETQRKATVQVSDDHPAAGGGADGGVCWRHSGRLRSRPSYGTGQVIGQRKISLISKWFLNCSFQEISLLKI